MKDTSPTEYEGTWSTKNNYAREPLEGSVYRINIIFEFYNVPQDADDYWFEIDYEGLSHIWPFGERLDVMYRWGTSGGFTHLVYYDHFLSDTTWDITSPSSTIFQLKFRGCAEVTDGIQHTWYFGDEPILH
ncbi:MAG: hypothetical protein GF309_12485, partial [Candidatus Lokiarchaeota archaeon]|nr:hypothetical protein [Candidatus Lokiarchaeota archaeon]